MKQFGKAGNVLLALLLMISSGIVRAEVSASLDRDRVAMGDTMRLTITATGNEQVNNTDLRALLADFEILQRSSSNNTSIVNGKRSQTRQLLIDITPRREGTLKIPPMRVGQATTNMLLVSVSPAPDNPGGNDTVVFEAEVDRDNVYVQGQVILTLRVQQAINLESRSITELQLDNAFVKALEQNSFQRNRGGRPWLVHEVRYAIFPEQSGTLEIPEQVFSARESQPRRSFFDLNSGGRQLRRKTEPLRIEVLPRPDTYPDSTWLPARKLTISENWSSPPDQLRVGESATRTISIRGEGLQGAQLPPVLFPATAGLKYYPDQPVINETETASGLLGTRQDSAALVPTRAGSLDIPEIRIPWWDTEAQELRYAVLPARQLSIAAADPGLVAPAQPAPTPITEGESITLTPAGAGSQANSVWMWLAAFSSAGWLLTLIYLLRSRRRSSGPEHEPGDSSLSEKQAFKHLLATCSSSIPAQARKAIIDWSATLFPAAGVVSLEQVAATFQNPDLDKELGQLDSSLYGTAANEWSGAKLADLAQRLRKQQMAAASGKDEQLVLYPAPGALSSGA